jgi:hypothetical protein
LELLELLLVKELKHSNILGEKGNGPRVNHPIDKHQEERKDVVGAALDLNCERGAVWNRMGNRMSSAGGDRGEEGG